MSFDLQVNGYGGVDFNSDALSLEELHLACERLEADGVSGFLLTLITDDLSALEARLRRLVVLRESDELARRLIAGFHVEGPFINPSTGFRGTHPERFIIPASVEGAKRLCDAAGGLLRLVTLAPEYDSGFATTRFLSDSGVRVAAGHCDPTLEQLRGAIDAGLSMWTHLGNGCPLVMERHDNVIQRALSLSEKLWLCFIADGVHVPFFALKNYLRAATCERCIVVTDAIAPAGLGPGRYTLGQLELDIGADMVARAPTSAGGAYLAGSAITMPHSIANLREQVGLSPAQLVLLTSDNPRCALGL
ncbi:N-acetylglucosamine-6-phosphate deacetylase [bacterium]|nr:MAG: N-acetylglucosamine-6-phosphate deacetylase [bacterium]